MNNKRGVSEIVSYILLIVLAVSMSLLVYAWMKNYIPKQGEECPDTIKLMVSDYSCVNGKIDINFKNRGNFAVDGFTMGYANDAKKTIYKTLGDSEGNYFHNGRTPLAVGENQTLRFDYTNTITSLQIIPLKIIGQDLVVCGKSIVKVDVENCLAG